MNSDSLTHEYDEKKLGTGYMQLKSLFEKLLGKKIRFCLKDNNYDRLVFFEAVLAGCYPYKQLLKMGSIELTDWTYKIENDKGIEIHLPIQNLIRIDEPESLDSHNYFLIFEKHFWTLEVLAG